MTWPRCWPAATPGRSANRRTPVAVRVERSGPVTTVILDRPEVRNAVDGPTAAALAEAFAGLRRGPRRVRRGAVRRGRHVLRRAPT